MLTANQGQGWLQISELVLAFGLSAVTAPQRRPWAVTADTASAHGTGVVNGFT
jgi:hypothetical protein